MKKKKILIAVLFTCLSMAYKQVSSAETITGNTTYSENKTVDSGSLLYIEEQGDLTNDAELTNSGSISNKGKFWNKKKLNNKASSSFQNRENGNFINDGEVETEKKASSANWGNFTNNGTVTNNGTTSNYGDFKNSGKVTVGAEGNFSNSKSSSLTEGDVKFSNDGTFEVEKGGTVFNNAEFENTGDVNVSGYFTNYGKDTQNGSLNNSGNLTFSQGSNFSNSGSVTNDTDGNITNDGYVLNYGKQSNFENKGSITNNGSFSNWSKGNMTNSGNITNNGNMSNDAGSKFANSGDITNNKTFKNSGFMELKDSGSITNNDTFENNNNLYLYNDSSFVNNGNITSKDEAKSHLYLRGNSTLKNNGEIDQYSIQVGGGSFENTENGKTSVDSFLVSNDGYHVPSVSNEGTLNVDKQLKNTKGTINNSGTLNLGKDSTTLNNGTLNNTGDIINEGKITNNGDINTEGLIQSVQGKFENNGNVSVKGNGADDGSGGNFVVNDLTNAGNIDNDNGTMNFLGDTTNSGDITNNGLMSNNGKLTSQNGGKLTNGSNGKLTNYGEVKGSVLNDGGQLWNTPNEDAQLEGKIDSVVNQNGGIFTNNGEVTNSVQNKDQSVFNNNKTVKGAVKNTDGGIVNNSAEGTIEGQVENFGGTVNNAGKIEKDIRTQNGVVNNNGEVKGKTYVTGDSTVNNSGKMESILGSEATVNNSGTIEKGLQLNDSTVNNDGTIKGTISAENGGQPGNLTLNNNSNGTLDNVNIKNGATVNNEGNLKGNIQVDDNSQLHLGAGTTFEDGAKVQLNGLLDATNGKFDDYTDGGEKFEFQNGASVKTDISSSTGKTDKFSQSTSEKQVTLEDFKVIPDTLVSKGYISKDELEKNLGVSISEFGEDAQKDHKFLSPLRYLNAKADGNGISFGPTGNSYKDFNPAIMAAPVAAQIGGYLNQLNSYDEAFRNMDMYMLMTKSQRQALKYRNKYAASDSNLAFDPTNTPYDNTSAWFRPYATFENVELKKGPKVSNVAWGSFFGADSELIDLGNGWDGMFGAYLGYNGSHQAYDGISIYQNGATLGLVGMAYKNNFFTGLTANVGSNIASADSIYGTDDFTLLMSGVASKTGYNFELADGKFIIQPSYLMSYSFVNTFDYTNAAGIRVNGDPLHAIQFEPGLKFIGNLNNGWQPYAGVSVVWNALDKTEFKASDATLPELSVKPFVKYGIGVRKNWGERLVGFFQTFFTSGGRNGVGLQAGVRMTLGNAQPKHANATGERKFIAKK